MEISIENLRAGSSAYIQNGEEIVITCEEIKEAITSGHIEDRAMQLNQEKLISDWKKMAEDESIKAQKSYHINRIATLCKTDLTNQPIIVGKLPNSKYKLIDGGHRVWALRCKGETIINALEIQIDESFSREEKLKICDEVTKCKGDSAEALKNLGYNYK